VLHPPRVGGCRLAPVSALTQIQAR